MPRWRRGACLSRKPWPQSVLQNGVGCRPAATRRLPARLNPLSYTFSSILDPCPKRVGVRQGCRIKVEQRLEA
jgi:hypothetical protein